MRIYRAVCGAVNTWIGALSPARDVVSGAIYLAAVDAHASDLPDRGGARRSPLEGTGFASEGIGADPESPAVAEMVVKAQPASPKPKEAYSPRP